jgi:hypothetical protein
MSTGYLDRAKKKQQMGTAYTFNNMPGNRGSMYEVNNEMEQVIVENNLKNIHRISTSNIKLPIKENNSILSGISNSAYNTFKENNNLDEKSENSSMKSGVGLTGYGGVSGYSALNSSNMGMNLQLQPVNYNNNNLQLIPLINKDMDRLKMRDSPPNRNRIDFQNFHLGNEMDNTSSYSPNRQNQQNNHISHRINTNHNQHLRSMTPPGTGKNIKSQNYNPNFNHNFSEIFKPPVKKGMFSYPKSNQLNNINSSGLKPASNSQPNFVNGNNQMNLNMSQLTPMSFDKNNFNNSMLNSQNILIMQSSVQNIPPFNRNDISNISQIQNMPNIDVSASNLSIPRVFSDKYQQYQIPKVSSNTNLTNKSVNLADENDSMSMALKKNDSTSSFNFNKYKVGLGLGLSYNKEANSQENLSSSNLFGHSSNPEISNMWNHNLAGGENSINNQSSQNLHKIEVEKDSNINTKSDRYHTFSNNDKAFQFAKKNQFQNNSEGIQFNLNSSHNVKFMDEKTNSANSATNQISPLLIQENNSIFKNKPRHEKEIRRMLVEMIKMKMRQINKDEGEVKSDLNKILDEMKISPLILDRENNSSVENLSKSKKNLNNSNLHNLQSLQQTPQTKMTATIESKLNSPRTENLNSQLLPYQAMNNSQLTNSVEIKNNNFEINNNYFGTINVPESGNTLTNNKSLPQFIYNLEEDTNEKINLLCYLSTPRVLRMQIGSTYNGHKVPFMFQLSPTNLCHVYGVEHYILQWSDLYNMAPVRKNNFCI